MPGSKTSTKSKAQTIRLRTSIVNALNEMLEVFCSHAYKSFDEVMANALLPISNAVKADRIILYQKVEINHETRLKQMYRWVKAEGKITARSISYLPNSPAIIRWTEILQQDKHINKRLSDMPEAETAFLKLFGIKSILMIPVFSHGEFWGVLVFQDHTKGLLFDEDCIDLMRSVARTCTYAIIHTEIQNEIEDANELNRVMSEAAPVGLTIFDDECKIVDCNNTALQIFNINKKYFLRHFFSLSPDYQPDGSKSLDKQLEIMKRTISGDKINMEWMYCSPVGELIPCDISMVRIKNKDKYIGLSYAYDLRSIKRLEKNIQWLEKEVDKIHYDPLTGIYNRLYLDKNLERIVKSLSRSGSTLSFMMIDIDRFKKYNDTYGHQAGDACLKTVAQTMAGFITRSDDFVARYGGEEFAVVLPNTDEQGACLIAEKLLEGLRNCNIPHRKNDAAKYVTVSIGVTTGIVDQSKSGDEFIKRADEMLYVSKMKGRNRYSFASLD